MSTWQEICETAGVPYDGNVDYDAVVEALAVYEIAEMFNLNDYDEEILKAALDAGFAVDDAINYIQEGVEFAADVTTYEKLGYYYTESLGLDDWVYNYFDFEKFGRECAIDGYLTAYGWLRIG